MRRNPARTVFIVIGEEWGSHNHALPCHLTGTGGAWHYVSVKITSLFRKKAVLKQDFLMCRIFRNGTVGYGAPRGRIIQRVRNTCKKGECTRNILIRCRGGIAKQVIIPSIMCLQRQRIIAVVLRATGIDIENGFLMVVEVVNRRIQ